MNILYAPRAGKSSFNTVAAIAYFIKELKNEEEGGVIIPMDAYVVCSMCGHRLDSYGLHDARRHNDYDMPLCCSCFQKLEEDKQHPIHKICEKRHRMFMDYIHYEYKKQEEKTMDYNKKKDTSIDIKRKVTREEDVTIDSILDLDMGDKIRIIIGGEVYEAMVARRPVSVYSGEPSLDLVVNVDKPLSKSWKELGYDCFEDMINDIVNKYKEDN